jgi:CO/xanthine dehydrogenase FAD-binding subunit
MWQSYEIPASVEEALDTLARYKGQAHIISGGTDLIIEIQEGRRNVECLVDVTRIPGQDRIERQSQWIVLGSGVTFRQIKESPLVREHARVLCEAAASVGALQIQTVATLAGNIVSALPAADGSVALVALEAEVEVADEKGRRWQPIAEMFLGPGQSAINPTQQMITAIRFPASGPRQGSAWERIGRRRALVLPILNCAISVALDASGQRFEWARIGLGPVAPVPFRARQTEAFLAGRPTDADTLEQAAQVAVGESHPRTSLLRASKEYRIKVLDVLVAQGLARAVAQAQERLAQPVVEA